MQKILIIGATSAIAEATARRFAARGDELFLLARDASRLPAIADDLKVRGAARVLTAVLDVQTMGDPADMIGRVLAEWPRIDIVLIAHGTLSDQTCCQDSVARLRQEFETNALSVMALLTPLANHMQSQGSGTLAVISSVAGDRGRQSNYVYGAAKAAVSAFLSGLRQRLTPHGVNVLTIKPGFVDTPMTRDFKKSPLWAQPSAIAEGIERAIGRRRGVVYLPWFWGPIMLVIRHIPEFVFRRLKL